VCIQPKYRIWGAGMGELTDAGHERCPERIRSVRLRRRKLVPRPPRCGKYQSSYCASLWISENSSQIDSHNPGGLPRARAMPPAKSVGTQRTTSSRGLRAPTVPPPHTLDMQFLYVECACKCLCGLDTYITRSSLCSLLSM
jgi:hypothetical protein